MDMDWHKEFIKMPHRMAKDCYMSPQDTIAVQRSIRIFLMREKVLQTSGCSAVQYVYNFFRHIQKYILANLELCKICLASAFRSSCLT